MPASFCTAEGVGSNPLGSTSINFIWFGVRRDSPNDFKRSKSPADLTCSDMGQRFEAECGSQLLRAIVHA